MHCEVCAYGFEPNALSYASDGETYGRYDRAAGNATLCVPVINCFDLPSPTGVSQGTYSLNDHTYGIECEICSVGKEPNHNSTGCRWCTNGTVYSVFGPCVSLLTSYPVGLKRWTCSR